MFTRQIRLSKITIRNVYYFIFTISGFSGLIYESIWSHYLKLFLGHASYSQILVISTYMGGLAIGAWFIGKITYKIKRLILMYAVIEGIIGISAVLFHDSFNYIMNFVFFSILPKLNTPFSVTFIKWLFSAFLILPQTILLGMTFPLMSAGIMRGFTKERGKSLSFLYFTNSSGAVIGILISGFVLIPTVGLPGTILFAGLTNIVLALAVYLMAHNQYFGLEPIQIDSQKRLDNFPVHNFIFILLSASLLTGMASFLYEIGWMRMLSIVLGSSTHSFELMLSAFIFGLALGSFWISRKIEQLKHPLHFLSVVQIVMGLIAISTLFFYNHTFDLMAFFIKSLAKSDQGYFLFNCFSYAICFLLMVPTAFCAGMTLPLVTIISIQNGYGEGSIGKIYAWNTIGAISGIIMGVIFMPILSLKNVIYSGGIIDILLGIILLWCAWGYRNRVKLLSLGSIIISIIIAFHTFYDLDICKMVSTVFRGGNLTKRHILFHKDGRTATIDLFQTNDQITISTNGKPDGSIHLDRSKLAMDESTQILLSSIPIAINPYAQNAAVIGFGTGMTSHNLLFCQNLHSIDIVEIEPAIVDVAKGFGKRVENNFLDPRVEIHFDDAKTFFMNNQKIYDLIISEPSNPWVSGVSSLFTKEFYSKIQPFIKQNGLFVQWMHLYEMNTPLIASVFKSISLNFHYYDVYVMDVGNIILICSNDPINPIDNSIFENDSLNSELKRMGIHSIDDFFVRYLGSKNLLDPLFMSYEISPNSDYFPILDLNAVQARFKNDNAFELYNLKQVPIPIYEVLDTKYIIPDIHQCTSKSDGDGFFNKYGEASKLYHYFIDNKNKSAYQALTSQSKRDIHVIQNTITDKDTFDLTNLYLPYLQGMAEKTLPYLNEKDASFIWNKIASSPSVRHCPDSVKSWIYFYQNIANRHYFNILQIALDMLPKTGNIKSSGYNDYFLASILLSSLALDNYEECLKIWKRFENKESPPFTLRFLWAHVKENLCIKQPL